MFRRRTVVSTVTAGEGGGASYIKARFVWIFVAERGRRNQCCEAQSGLNTRFVDGGFLASLLAGRRGRATSSPPQFGHTPFRTFVAQAAQNVHSNEQMRASPASGGRALSQHSQPGLSSSIGCRSVGAVGSSRSERQSVPVQERAVKQPVASLYPQGTRALGGGCMRPCPSIIRFGKSASVQNR